MNTRDTIVVIRHTAQAGKGAVAKRQLLALIAIVVANEAGCREIIFHQDPADDTRFLLYKRWDSKESYVGPHMQTAHMNEFIRQAADALILPPEITYWEAVAS